MSPSSAPENFVHEPIAEADTRVTFEELGVMPDIVEALAEIGITHPFPIQALSIPIAIQGTDMIGQARTGTGKTLAFGISLLQRIAVPGQPEYDELDAPGKPQALVMCPTRELALQVTRDIAIASTKRKARVMTVYGGVGYDPQLDQLTAGVDVVVGTPGRLKDLADRRSLDLSHVKVLVLDEADEMLDLGFLPDVEKLIARTPSTRQTMLFSATMPSAIAALARTHLSHPVNIRAEAHDAQATVPDTTQFIYQAHNLDKPEIIAKLLQVPDADKIMVFCKTKRGVQRLTDDLIDRGFEATCIHGDLTQVSREKALKRFREGKVQVIVATDVAARGIDVANVSHVVNFECPDDEKTYVHRIGRTGRAGKKGIAVTLVDWADVTRWKVINRMLDLPFPEIAESYSSSPELMADLGIPAGTKGRIVPTKPRSEREDRGELLEQHGDRGSRGRDGGHGGRDGGHSGRDRDGGRGGRDRDGGQERSRPKATETESGEAKPRRDRVRRRNGEPIVGDGTAVPLAIVSATAEDGATKPHRRRRRRSGGDASGAPAVEAASAAE
jgi:superfamily II DNA/RNA helicase